jgi:hypothetical protein
MSVPRLVRWGVCGSEARLVAFSRQPSGRAGLWSRRSIRRVNGTYADDAAGDIHEPATPSLVPGCAEAKRCGVTRPARCIAGWYRSWVSLPWCARGEKLVLRQAAEPELTGPQHARSAAARPRAVRQRRSGAQSGGRHRQVVPGSSDPSPADRSAPCGEDGSGLDRPLPVAKTRPAPRRLRQSVRRRCSHGSLLRCRLRFG